MVYIYVRMAYICTNLASISISDKPVRFWQIRHFLQIQTFLARFLQVNTFSSKLLPRFTHFLQDQTFSSKIFQDICKNNVLPSKILEVKSDRFLQKMYGSSTGVYVQTFEKIILQSAYQTKKASKCHQKDPQNP